MYSMGGPFAPQAPRILQVDCDTKSVRRSMIEIPCSDSALKAPEKEKTGKVLPSFPRPAFLYVESAAVDEPLTRRLLALFPEASVHEIQDHRRLDAEAVPLRGYNSLVKQQVLVLARNPGAFVRPFWPQSCEGDRHFFIAHANGCPFDCQYCFLQAYFAHGAPVIFANLQDLLQELDDHLRDQERLGPATYHGGELSDALALEPLSGFARQAVEVFRRRPGATLELRTKCAGIESLLPAQPPPNVVCSWTLTPEEAWRLYEIRTPSPLDRLCSARACQDKGYRVGIRLDPALRYPGWEKGYADLVAAVFENLDPKGIESFVLGGFRYLPGLASRIRQRFPESSLLLEEFVQCRDGKYRYFRPLRINLYRSILAEIRRHDPGIPVRIAMESEPVHREVLERPEPSRRGGAA